MAGKADPKRQPPDPERELPCDIETEKLILGSILSGQASFADVLLTDADFLLEDHRRYWCRMRDLASRSEEIDRVTLTGELQRQGQLATNMVGYVADLGRDAPPVVRIDSWVRILKEKTARRLMIFTTDSLSKRSFLPSEDVDQLITEGETLFSDLRSRRPETEPAPSSISQWPDPLQPEAFHGIAGEIVKAIERHTEADPAALLIQFLVGIGSLIGRGAYYLAEADRHYTNLYTVIVGATSKGRKGTSWGRIESIFEEADSTWVENCQIAGLGSGEAVIDCLNHDDHRRLVMESEFARLLAVIARDGTTLSAIFRQCWDKGRADVTVRGKEAHVKAGHLSMIGHVTRDELLRRLSDTEVANGFGNRILWPCAKRSKELPHGGGVVNFGNIPRQLTGAIGEARRSGTTRIQFDSKARTIWEGVYHDLSEGRPGLFGAITNRAEAQVVRLSIIYALLDSAREIRGEHLQAALAVWKYCDDSARYIWGDSIGDPTADGILKALRGRTEGLTQTEISRVFSGNKPASELARALGMLMERGLIRVEKEKTGGGDRTCYWIL